MTRGTKYVSIYADVVKNAYRILSKIRSAQERQSMSSDLPITIETISGKMTDDRWKALLSFFQFIVGTVLVGIFGTIINNRIQTREVEIKEQEQIFRNLGYVLSANPADKYLMAQFYARVTRSDEIRERWISYRDELSAEIAKAAAEREKLQSEIAKTSDAKLIEKKQSAIDNIDAQIIPKANQPVQDALPTRIYFHIQNEAQRERAAHVAGALAQNAGLAVPGIELVRNAPASSQLRYFRSVDATEAGSIAGLLALDGVVVNPVYISGYESSRNIRPRHFELWLSRDWK